VQTAEITWGILNHCHG